MKALITILFLTASAAYADSTIRFECSSAGASWNGLRASVSGTAQKNGSSSELLGALNVDIFQGRKKIAEIRQMAVSGLLIEGSTNRKQIQLRSQNLSLAAVIGGNGPSHLILADSQLLGVDQSQNFPLQCR